jgi:hypothetical protein
MNQKQLPFFYRGVLFFLLAGLAVTALSSSNEPWASSIKNVAGVLLFIAMGAFIIFVVFRNFAQVLNAPIPDEPLPPSLHADKWYSRCRLAVVGCVLLSVILLAVLLFVTPPKQCPGWHLPDQRATSMWLPSSWSMLVLAGLLFMIIRWDWLIEKAIASVDYPTETPVTYILVITVLGGCAMSQLPWALLLSQCRFVTTAWQ